MKLRITRVSEVLTDGAFGLLYPRCHSQRVAELVVKLVVKLVVSRYDDGGLGRSSRSGSAVEVWRHAWLRIRR